MANFTEIGVIATVKDLTSFNAGMGIMRRQMGLTGRSASSFSKGFNTSFGNVGKTILDTGRSIRSFGNELTFLGFQLTFLATGAFAAVTQAGSEFESTLVRMSTLASASVDQLGELGQVALDLSKQVGIGPTEIADAMFDIVSSGFSAAEAMEIIQSTSRGAAIGLGDVRAVTDAVTSAMRAFADEGLTASRATDILVQAVREGKGEVDRLAPTLGRVLGIAAEMGLTFEETTAFIATFTRVGVPVEVAVTSLRSALTALLKPTEASKTAMAEYGLTAERLQEIISERGLAAALFTLAQIFEADSEGMSKVVGSARGLAGILINTGPLAADYAQVLAAIGIEADQTAESFDLFAQTTEFKLNAAKAAFESLFITISNTLRPLINLVLDQIPRMTEALEEFVRLNPKIALLAGAFAALVAAIGPLLVIVGLTITSFGTFISVIGAGITFFSGLIGPIALVTAALAAFVVFFNDTFVNVFQSVRNTVNAQGQAISNDAFGWGRNIIVQFARGMAQAAVFVIQVLNRIGQVIASLLRPGSPPKLLPDLDVWGKGAMEAYMAGWLQADFNVFQEIAGVIESFLRSIGLDQVDVVPALLNIRTELARIIDVFRETGKVATDAIDNITASFGDAGDIIGQYILAMLEVEEATNAVAMAQEELREAQEALTKAQEELNTVQEKYNALLEPISDELEAIARRRQEVIDDMRIAELQAIINDENAPALAKELALMELREIELRRQQQAIEDQQEAAEEAAKANIDSAQEAVDAAQEELELRQRELDMAEERVQALHQFIQVQEQNNNLIQEQINLLKSLEESLDGVGGALEDIGDIGDIDLGDLDLGGPGGPDDEEKDPLRFLKEAEDLLRRIGGPGGPDDLGFGSLGNIFGDITKAAEDMVASFQGIGEDIKREWQPAIDAFGTLEDTWAGVFETLTTGIPPDSAIGRVTEFIKGITADQVTKVGNLATEFERLFGNLQGIATGPIGQLVSDVASLVVSIIALAAAIKDDSAFGREGPFSDLSLNIDNLGEAILEALIPVQKFTKLLQFVNETIELIAPGVGKFITRIKIDFENFKTFLDGFDPFSTFHENLSGAVAAIKKTIRLTFEAIVADITGSSDKSDKRLRRLSKDGQNIFQKFSDAVAAAGGIMPLFASLIAGEGGIIPTFFDDMVGPKGILTKLGITAPIPFELFRDTAIDYLTNPETGLIARVQGAFETLRTWIGEQIESFKQAGRDIGQGLLDGITEMVQPLIDFLQGLLLQLQGVTQQTNDSDSPSKVYAQFGRDMIDGLILGMTQRAAEAMAAMHEIMTMTQSATAGTIARPVSAPTALPSTSVTNMRESSIGPINVYNGIDLATLRALIHQEVNGSL